MGEGFVGDHILHDAAGGAQNFDDLAGVIVRNVDRSLLDRLELVAVFVRLVHNLRTTDLELESFTTHGLHEDGQMKNASAGNANAGMVFRLLDAHGDIALPLAHQTLLQLARANDIAFTTDNRARGRFEHDSHRRLFDGNGLELDRVLTVGDDISDVSILNANDRDDIARLSLGNFGLSEILERIDLADLCVVFAAIGLFDQHKFFFMHNAAMKTTDADTAFVAAMVDGAHLQSNRCLNLHLGSGNLLQNGIEQRNHVHIAVFGIEAGIAVHCRGIYHGEVELIIGSTELNHKVEYLVDRTFGRSCSPLPRCANRAPERETRRNESGAWVLRRHRR